MDTMSLEEIDNLDWMGLERVLFERVCHTVHTQAAQIEALHRSDIVSQCAIDLGNTRIAELEAERDELKDAHAFECKWLSDQINAGHKDIRELKRTALEGYVKGHRDGKTAAHEDIANE